MKPGLSMETRGAVAKVESLYLEFVRAVNKMYGSPAAENVVEVLRVSSLLQRSASHVIESLGVNEVDVCFAMQEQTADSQRTALLTVLKK